ncbi:MAG: hypothetical protein NTZ65_03205 [Candidatus Berkelbacteria bacterium]|nr:hypothetical protein [Candidatus Berkelbacteria bacterium]
MDPKLVRKMIDTLTFVGEKLLADVEKLPPHVMMRSVQGDKETVIIPLMPDIFRAEDPFATSTVRTPTPGCVDLWAYRVGDNPGSLSRLTVTGMLDNWIYTSIDHYEIAAFGDSEIHQLHLQLSGVVLRALSDEGVLKWQILPPTFLRKGKLEILEACLKYFEAHRPEATKPLREDDEDDQPDAAQQLQDEINGFGQNRGGAIGLKYLRDEEINLMIISATELLCYALNDFLDAA